MRVPSPPVEVVCRGKPAGWLPDRGAMKFVMPSPQMTPHIVSRYQPYRLVAPVLGALLLCSNPAGAEIKEQIVAVVNDEIITYSELDKILSPIFEQYERIYSGAELFSMLQKARRDVLEQLTEEKLILAEAEKQSIREQMGDEFAKEVERSIAEIKSKFPSEDVFLKKLEREGMTLEEFRSKQEERTLVRAMLIKEISSKCHVSPGEVRDYYKNNSGEYGEKEKVHVSQIWIKNDPGGAEEAENKANEIFKKLEAGEPFADLAKKYSQGPYAGRGGEWGFISRGHWNSELEEAAFALEPGKHSGIVKSTLGYHIILLQERKPPSVKPLDEVYAEIESKLFQEKAARKRKEWISQLKSRAYISIN